MALDHNHLSVPHPFGAVAAIVAWPGVAALSVRAILGVITVPDAETLAAYVTAVCVAGGIGYGVIKQYKTKADLAAEKMILEAKIAAQKLIDEANKDSLSAKVKRLESETFELKAQVRQAASERAELQVRYDTGDHVRATLTEDVITLERLLLKHLKEIRD
jgi:hypothetical protein